MRRGLQIVLAILSLIPLWFGILNTTGGAARFLDPDLVNAALDSQFRFQSAWYLALAPIIWWVIPQVEKQTMLFRIIVALIFIGGLGRVWAATIHGMPPSTMIGGMMLELIVPVLIPWQARVARDAQAV
ncbi:MAG: DUF4345 domain-containing protein [Rhodobacter sp.]|nr:DUF4345 domain-containing protein [Rhodobacter sp.]